MSHTIEKTDKKVAVIPKWAVVAAVVLLAIGIGIGATRPARTRAKAIAALNNCNIRMVEKSEGSGEDRALTEGYRIDVHGDGGFLENYYGCVAVLSNQRDYEEIMGWCTARTTLAKDVFSEVMRNGTWQGKALACHMAFYLAQEKALTREDVELMVQLLSDPNMDLRRVAQRELGFLLLLPDIDKRDGYELIGAAPATVKGLFAAKVAAGSPPDIYKRNASQKSGKSREWLAIRWSCPEACQAWWKAFGSKVTWDPDLLRFTIRE